jgi:hypothetical protein
MPVGRRPLRAFATIVLAVLCGAGTADAQRGTASGTLTIDGRTFEITHAIRTSRRNVFNDFFSDHVVILSNVEVSAEEAAADAALVARARKGELVTVAVRYDGRPRRGQLFNIAINHRDLSDTALLADVWFKHTFQGGKGTLSMDRREFSGHMYAVDVSFSVPMPEETSHAAPAAGASLPPPSKTDGDRAKASALLIEALQEGDEQRSLDIIKLGIDPNARDEKMQIPLINWAVLMCQPPVVAALVELKADLSHERLPGMTLLAEARAACPDAVGFLRAGGAK